MTHAESQDLLLDLAYGELSPARAAEVEDHLAGCAECQREKAALDEVRRLAAPLRELEEPPHGFDDRILAAARAQAQLEHEGNIGQVVEVQGSVRPLGLEPAQIDAHRKVAPPPPRRPRWAMRVALGGGSVAAAAVLALVVSSSLQSKREAEPTALAKSKPYEIRVQPAPVAQVTGEAVSDARKDQVAKLQAEHDAAGASRRDELVRQKEPRYAPPSPGPEKKMRAPHAVAEDEGARGRVVGGVAGAQGSGGDAFERKASSAARTPDSKVASKAVEPAAPTVASRVAEPAAPKVASGVAEPAAPKVASKAAELEALKVASKAEEPAGKPAAAAPAASSPASAGTPSAAERSAMQAIAARPPPAQVASAVKAANAPPPAQSAEQLEKLAQEARHRGDYPMAASLYRSAADLRQAEAAESPAAAWDLAHAVECFAADGRFDEARQVRDLLSRLYPSQSTALAAAGRALRSVDGPASAPPAAKAKKATSQDSAVPADF